MRVERVAEAGFAERGDDLVADEVAGATGDEGDRNAGRGHRDQVGDDAADGDGPGDRAGDRAVDVEEESEVVHAPFSLGGPRPPEPAGQWREMRKGPAVLRTMLTSQIHRATVTHADLHHVGSLTVDLDLMVAADLLPGEQVAVVGVTNGSRFETYPIAGERGSGVIGVNGAAAHLADVGDTVIVISYAQLDNAEARAFVPSVVHVDGRNRIVAIGADPAEAFAEGVSSPPFAEAAPTGRLAAPTGEDA